MPKNRVIIVEDDKNISKLVKYNFEKDGYDCTVVYNGEKAIETIGSEPFDLAIVDIMLPGVDGLEVCRAIKQDARTKKTAIIILTAKGEEVDRVVGLEIGADDYMVKPFSTRELLLRAKAILRRGKPEDVAKKEVIIRGNLTVDIARHKVIIKEKNKEAEPILTPMEFKLLVTLLEREGRVQSREILLRDVWSIDTLIDTRTIDTHIKHLRHKLGKAGNIIKTIRGLGYKIEDDLDED